MSEIQEQQANEMLPVVRRLTKQSGVYYETLNALALLLNNNSAPKAHRLVTYMRQQRKVIRYQDGDDKQRYTTEEGYDPFHAKYWEVKEDFDHVLDTEGEVNYSRFRRKHNYSSLVDRVFYQAQANGEVKITGKGKRKRATT